MCYGYSRLSSRDGKNLGGIIIPSLPSNEEPKPYLFTDTIELKSVSDYTGYNFDECLELDCYTFKILVKDSLIDKMSKTKEGQEYLEKCWLIRQTEPDKKALRQKFKK